MSLLRYLVPTVVLGAMLITGCAQNVGDINRVQPNYVKKSDFAGQWYIRQTIADVPPNSSVSFVGMTLEMEKVRWEITEARLIAYRSYEFIPGRDPAVDQEGKEIGNTDIPRDEDGNPLYDEGFFDKDGYKEAPIAAYPIESHFDIQREYNTATGEQSNVIVENTSDRPWHERTYMRVDFASSMLTNSTNVTQLYWDYVTEDEGGVWAFRIEDENGDPVITDPTDPGFENRNEPTYLDWVSRGFYTPSMLNGYPLCWYIGEAADCAGSVVKVRTSVLKASEDITYEPRVFEDDDMVKFGYFRVERKTYDRRRGTTDAGQIFLAAIHNIWETSYDANDDLIPVGVRTPSPIVYALSPNFPEELIPETEEIARGYARSFTRAVAAAQGKTVDDVFAEFPYQETTPEPDGTYKYRNDGLYQLNYNLDGSALIGDLRHNFIYWVDQPQMSSPLGYGPSSPDPETGEIIASQAYVYGAAIDSYAQYALDLVDALNGDLDIEDLASGEVVRRHIEGARDRTDPRRRALAMGLEDALDKPISPDGLMGLDARKIEKLEAIRQFGLDEVSESLTQRLNKIKGTRFEGMMINDEIRGVLAAKLSDIDLATGPLTEDLLSAASPYTMDMGKQHRDLQIRQQWASENNIWLNDFQDGSVAGLAKYLKDQVWDRETMYQWLRGAIYRGVMEHEVGHTVGLRHNFQGSFDALNYFPEYWEQRKATINPNAATLNDLFVMSEQTQTQIDGRMREFQYSSLMDYGRGFNSDIRGLGLYDEAAILFGYADAVEVFTTAGSGFKSIYFEDYSDGTPRYENRGSLAYDGLLDDYHYTRMPGLLGDGNMDVGIERMYDRIVMPWQTVKALQEANDPNRFVEVPYLFCSDEWVGAIGSCQRWDEGADTWEQVRNVMTSWHEYYFFNNYRRGRFGWSAWDTYNRVYSRYFSYLPNFYQHWLFNVAFTSPVDNIQANYQAFGAFEGLNFLIDVLATPSYGAYDFNPAENAYELVSFDPEASGDFVLDKGEGRYPYTRYNYEGGYQYYYYPREAGHFWDYYAALQALSQSSVNVRGVETQSNFASYIIPYYLVFDAEMTRTYNGIIADDYRDYAPRVASSGVLVNRPAYDYLDLFPEGSQFIDNDPIIKPRMNFTNRFYALLFGLSSFTASYSLNYPDDHRIFRLGTGQTLDPDVTKGFTVLSFTDPSNGIQYAALNKLGEPPSAAVKRIQNVNQMVLDGASEFAIANEVEWLNIEGGLAEIYGRIF